MPLAPGEGAVPGGDVVTFSLPVAIAQAALLWAWWATGDWTYLGGLLILTLAG